VEFHNSAYSER
jgi:hypothetical protein